MGVFDRVVRAHRQARADQFRDDSTGEIAARVSARDQIVRVRDADEGSAAHRATHRYAVVCVTNPGDPFVVMRFKTPFHARRTASRLPNCLAWNTLKPWPAGMLELMPRSRFIS